MGYSPFLREITLRKAFFLSITYLPFLCQQKIADVAVLDPVSVPVELIQRDNIFRVVIADIVIRTELTLNGLIGCQHEYYGAAEPPVRCGESHLSGLTEPPHFVY